jgi:hypothetical protein
MSETRQCFDCIHYPICHYRLAIAHVESHVIWHSAAEFSTSLASVRTRLAACCADYLPDTAPDPNADAKLGAAIRELVELAQGVSTRVYRCGDKYIAERGAYGHMGTTLDAAVLKLAQEQGQGDE